MDPKRPFFYGWVMVGVAFSTEFVAGCFLYPFAVSLTQLADEFSGGDRAPIVSIQMLSSVFGIALTPFLGRLAGRGWIRLILMAGMVLLAGGLIAMAQTQTLWQVGLALTMLITVGANCLSGVAPTTLIVNWYERRRATVLGASQLGASLAGVALPPLVIWLSTERGWRGAYEVLGIVVLCLAPLVWRLTVGRPEERGLRIDGDAAESESSPAEAAMHEAPSPAPPFRTAQALREPNLWRIAMATGLAFMSSSSLLINVAAFGTDQGFSDSRAALLVSVTAGGSALGKLLFGWLSDRIGPSFAYMASLGGQALGLVALIGATGYATITGVLLLIGLAMGGTYPLASALLARVFGRDEFGPMFGLMYVLAAPVLLAGPILGAWIYDQRGSYDAAFGLFAFALIAATLIVRSVRVPPAEAS